MAIIEDVDDDSDASSDIEGSNNFEREERDFIARKEAYLREQELRQGYTKPQRSNSARKSKRRRQEQWSATNDALNGYLNGSMKIDGLLYEGSNDVLLQDTFEASHSVLQVDSAEDIVRKQGCSSRKTGWTKHSRSRTLQDIDVLERLACLLSKLHKKTESTVDDTILTGLLVEAYELLKVPRHFMLPDYEISMCCLT